MRIEDTTYGEHHAQFVERRLTTKPTAAQELRLKQRKRFNRLVITLPMGLVFFLWIALFLGMIWLSVAGEWFAMDTNQEHYRQLFSGVADVFTMLLLTPMLLLCALPIVGTVGVVVYRRKKRSEDPDTAPKLPLFWRIENKVDDVRDMVARTMPRLAQPVINMHSTVAFVKQLIFELKRFIRQEIFRKDE